jgi:hypothetical protein
MTVRRTPWVLLVASVVLLGTLDLHPGGEAFNGAGKFYSLSAKHPTQPTHFEGSQEAQRPQCPVCLHQLRTSGAHLSLAALIAAPVLAGLRQPLSTTLARERCAAPRGARGPPSFS